MKINVIKKRFDLTNEGKYNIKDVYKLLYQYNYEKIKNVGLYSHIKKRKVPKTPKKFSKLYQKEQLEKIIYYLNGKTSKEDIEYMINYIKYFKIFQTNQFQTNIFINNYLKLDNNGINKKIIDKNLFYKTNLNNIDINLNIMKRKILHCFNKLDTWNFFESFFYFPMKEREEGNVYINNLNYIFKILIVRKKTKNIYFLPIINNDFESIIINFIKINNNFNKINNKNVFIIPFNNIDNIYNNLNVKSLNHLKIKTLEELNKVDNQYQSIPIKEIIFLNWIINKHSIINQQDISILILTLLNFKYKKNNNLFIIFEEILKDINLYNKGKILHYIKKEINKNFDLFFKNYTKDNNDIKTKNYIKKNNYIKNKIYKYFENYLKDFFK